MKNQYCLCVLCVFECGSRSVVTRCRCRPSPRLPPETLVGGDGNGEVLLLMVGVGRKTGQHSHREHPGKWKANMQV